MSDHNNDDVPGTDTQKLKQSCAEAYASPLAQQLLGTSHNPGGAKLTRSLADDLRLGKKSLLLDVACGIGSSASLIAKEKGCRVTGVDFSAKNVDAGHTALRNEGNEIRDRVLITEGDAEALDFGGASFDGVLCECALSTFPHPERALSEMFRVLKYGGRLAIADVTRQSDIPDEAERLISETLFLRSATSTEDYAKMLRDAGFENIVTKDATWALKSLIGGLETKMAVGTGMTGNVTGHLPEWMKTTDRMLAMARGWLEEEIIGFTTLLAHKPRRKA